MWAIISGGVLAVLAVFFSLAKASSRADRMSESHREELMVRTEGPEEEKEEEQEEENF